MKDITYEIHNIEKDILPFVYHLDKIKFLYASPNWHENLEILLCTQGEGQCLLNMESYRFEKGDFAIVNSDAIHSVISEGGIYYHCFIIDNEFCKQNGIDMTKLRFSEIFKDEEMKVIFEDVIEKIEGAKNDRQLWTAPEIRLSVLKLICHLCKNHLSEKSDSSESELSSAKRVKSAITYIKDNLSEYITLDNLSSHIGISKYHLSREFKEFTGQTIFEFINNMRCRLAKRMIKEGSSVSEAALSSGFENLSYFSRKFKEITGHIPSYYTKTE